jgi:hypothetical protein
MFRKSSFRNSCFRSSKSSRRFVFLGLLLAALSVNVAVQASAQDSDAAKRGRKYKAPPPTSHVEVTVLRATTGKPVENAAVIFHPLIDGHDSGNMELKTNDEGKAMLDLLATGSNVRIQIIADGFQTWGEDYKVDKDNVAILVKLKRPTAQYSIYKKGEGAPAAKPDDAPKDAAPKDGDSKDAAPKDGADTKPDPAKSDPAKADPPKDAAKPQDSTTPPQ